MHADSIETRAERLAEMHGRQPASPVGGEAPQTTRRRRFGFVPVSDLIATLTPPDWLIRDHVEADALVMIFGDPECGKSFMALDWAASVATGCEWNGHRVKQGPVLYINGEGQNAMHRRLRAWSTAHGVALAHAPLYFSTMATALTDEMSRAELEAVIADFIAEFGPPALIVIDTLARNFGPGDENSTRDMTVAIATCDGVREMTGATVVLVHHSGHGDKARGRGAMALKGALDAEYCMKRGEGGHVTFEATKMKDAPRPEPLAFRFESVELGVEDEDGRQITSAVLRPAVFQATTAPVKSGGGKNQTRALQILVERCAQSRRNVEQSGRSPDQARVSVDVWRDLCVEAGIHRSRFNEVRNSLVNIGKVRMEFGFAYPVDTR